MDPMGTVTQTLVLVLVLANPVVAVHSVAISDNPTGERVRFFSIFLGKAPMFLGSIPIFLG